ncbi:hypothetical protein BDZ89DRAFT_1047979 [Hymenopellis radicata]|nr:hypothetical protein BDZ89DRAFT_1047979 [Hymenopellis radicata]
MQVLCKSEVERKLIFEMSKCSRCGFKPADSPVPDSQQQSAWNLDVLELIRSGHTPSSAVAPSIPGRVAALEARYQAMKDDLTSLVVLVAQLRAEMESTESEIEQTKSLAAPIRSLPREILLHIFFFVDIFSNA